MQLNLVFCTIVSQDSNNKLAFSRSAQFPTPSSRRPEKLDPPCPSLSNGFNSFHRPRLRKHQLSFTCLVRCTKWNLNGMTLAIPAIRTCHRPPLCGSLWFSSSLKTPRVPQTRMVSKRSVASTESIHSFKGGLTDVLRFSCYKRRRGKISSAAPSLPAMSGSRHTIVANSATG